MYYKNQTHEIYYNKNMFILHVNELFNGDKRGTTLVEYIASETIQPYTLLVLFNYFIVIETLDVCYMYYTLSKDFQIFCSKL
jgi:hypothetical protein